MKVVFSGEGPEDRERHEPICEGVDMDAEEELGW